MSNFRSYHITQALLKCQALKGKIDAGEDVSLQKTATDFMMFAVKSGGADVSSVTVYLSPVDLLHISSNLSQIAHRVWKVFRMHSPSGSARRQKQHRHKLQTILPSHSRTMRLSHQYKRKQRSQLLLPKLPRRMRMTM